MEVEVEVVTFRLLVTKTNVGEKLIDFIVKSRKGTQGLWIFFSLSLSPPQHPLNFWFYFKRSFNRVVNYFATSTLFENIRNMSLLLMKAEGVLVQSVRGSPLLNDMIGSV